MRKISLRNEIGNAVVEISLVCALIAVVCISSSSFVGAESDRVLQSVGYALGLVNENHENVPSNLGNRNNTNPGNGTNGNKPT